MKPRVVHLVAHLDVIGQGHIGDGIRVFLPAAPEGLEYRFPVRPVRLYTFVEDGAVFESAVHPLAEERHDGVRGVAQKEDPVTIVPGKTLERDQRSRGIVEVQRGQIGHQHRRIGELRLEKVQYLPRVQEAGETVIAFVGEEEGAGKAAVQIRQRDQHVQAPRPDVEGIGLHPVRAVRPCWNGQFLVSVGQVLLREVEPAHVHHRGSYGRSGAVHTDDPLRAERVDVIGRVVPDIQHTGAELHPRAPGVEMQSYAVLPLRGAEQDPVQFAAGYGVDDLFVPLAVGLEDPFAFHGMNQPSRHGYRHAQDFVSETDLPQRMESTGGHGQVDRPAGFTGASRNPTDIGPLFVYFDPETPPGEKNRQQGSRETRAYQGYGLPFDTHGYPHSVRDRNENQVSRPSPTPPP